MRLCSYCGRENDATRTACHECGSRLPAIPDSPVPPSASPPAFEQRNQKHLYLLLTFVVSAVVQLLLWLRLCELSQSRDWWPPISWHVLNWLLAGAALLVIAPVLRHGSVWQRFVAGLLACHPSFVIGGYYYNALTQ